MSKKNKQNIYLYRGCFLENITGNMLQKSKRIDIYLDTDIFQGGQAA